MNVFVFISLSLLLTTSLPAPVTNWKANLWFQDGWTTTETIAIPTRNLLEHKQKSALPARTENSNCCCLKHCQKWVVSNTTSELNSSLTFWNKKKKISSLFQAVLKATKGLKPKMSFTAGCPQWKTCFSGRKVGSLREWGETILFSGD